MNWDNCTEEYCWMRDFTYLEYVEWSKEIEEEPLTEQQYLDFCNWINIAFFAWLEKGE